MLKPRYKFKVIKSNKVWKIKIVNSLRYVYIYKLGIKFYLRFILRLECKVWDWNCK